MIPQACGGVGAIGVTAVVVAMVVGGHSCVTVAAPPASPGRPASLYGLEARGRRIVYVFDRSASMSEPDGHPLAEAKHELLSSLESLGSSRQFHVIFYNERVAVFAPGGNRGRPQFADEGTLREARRFIESVRAEGGTNHAQAIESALKLAPDTIFLLTDADEHDDLTDDELARLTRMAGGTCCMVAQFGGNEGRRSPRLEHLARATGGQYRVVDESPAE